MAMKKPVKIGLIVIASYVALVVIFESLLGVFQPEAGETMLITTYDSDGAGHQRVVARLESGGDLYVAANHWPRNWYYRVLETPRMNVDYEGSSIMYSVEPLANSSAEYERVDAEHSLPLVFRFLTGFPPRRLLRLDPLVN